jgi:phosphohistidine phosphatase SixA
MPERRLIHSAALVGAWLAGSLAAATPGGLQTIALAAEAPGATVAEASAMSTPSQLVERLRAGGCVIVMRHAKSPFAPPAARDADPGNARVERQLDAQGKADARALGMAVRALNVPIGPIYSSPTFRALETIRIARLGEPRIIEQLAESAHGMAGSAGESQAAWLRHAVAQPPPPGTNTLIVTHTPNIEGAFGKGMGNVQAGEMLVFLPEPDASGARGARPIGRMTIADWKSLAIDRPPHS